MEKAADSGMTPVTEPGSFRVGKNKASQPYWTDGFKAIVFYCLIIWIPACWILGSTYKQKDYVKNLNVVVADLDGSGIGKSIWGACEAISGQPSRPSFQLRRDYTMYQNVYDEVYNGHYWGGIVIHRDATKNFTEAFLAGDTSYNSSRAVSLIYNSARWPATTYGYISPVLSSVVSASLPAFKKSVGAQLLHKANGTTTPEMFDVFFDPYTAAKDDIHPFDIGARYFLGTAGIVFPTIVTFFVSLGIRATYEGRGFLRKFDGVVYREGIAAITTLIGGLSYAAWVAIFHENSEFSGKTFVLVWMVMWLYGFACYQFFDNVATGAPVALIPPITLTFMIVQVTASAFPHTIKQRFYRIDNAMPSFNAFELLITVITHGSTNNVGRNIGVLLAWSAFWFLVNFFVHWRYVHKNLKQQQDKSDLAYGSDMTAVR